MVLILEWWAILISDFYLHLQLRYDYHSSHFLLATFVLLRFLPLLSGETPNGNQDLAVLPVISLVKAQCFMDLLFHYWVRLLLNFEYLLLLDYCHLSLPMAPFLFSSESIQCSCRTPKESNVLNLMTPDFNYLSSLQASCTMSSSLCSILHECKSKSSLIGVPMASVQIMRMTTQLDITPG